MKILPLNEVARKAVHLCSSIIPLGYHFYPIDKQIILVILFISVILAILLETARIRIKWVQNIFSRYFDFMMRDQEKKGLLTGATWLLLGAFIVILVFPKEYAIPSLLYLTVGDTFAAIVGLVFPIGKIGNKTLSGSVAGFTISLIFVLFIVKNVNPNILILGSFAAMIVECSPIPLNDNITVPIISGFIMLLGTQIF